MACRRRFAADSNHAFRLDAIALYLYRERHLVECFIGKIKHFRRIFSRFDKLANRYLGFLYFASALIWLR